MGRFEKNEVFLKKNAEIADFFRMFSELGCNFAA